jgi:hypothetical protein
VKGLRNRAEVTCGNSQAAWCSCATSFDKSWTSSLTFARASLIEPHLFLCQRIERLIHFEAEECFLCSDQIPEHLFRPDGSDRVALLELDAPEIRKRVVDARAFELVVKLIAQHILSNLGLLLPKTSPDAVILAMVRA